MVVILTLVCALVIGGLAVISQGSPSAAQFESVALQTPEITPDEGCVNFASFWTVETGLDVPVEAIEGLSNCRLSAEGQWFVPEGANDPRLAGRSVLTAQEEVRVDPLRTIVREDFRALDLRLPDSLIETLAANYATENLPVFGHTKRGRVDFGAKHARYQRITQAFLLSPSRAELANYVGWVMERRSIAVGQFEAACSAQSETHYLLRACMGMGREFGVGLIPIYWELMDPVVMQEYLTSRARSEMPLPSASPAPSIE